MQSPTEKKTQITADTNGTNEPLMGVPSHSQSEYFGQLEQRWRIRAAKEEAEAARKQAKDVTATKRELELENDALRRTSERLRLQL